VQRGGSRGPTWRLGDLVFFHSSSGAVYHVSIYAGAGEIWTRRARA
jgi:cell wall-associated NlpC family hydrolase